jgi:hypothetical protein
LRAFFPSKRGPFFLFFFVTNGVTFEQPQKRQNWPVIGLLEADLSSCEGYIAEERDSRHGHCQGHLDWFCSSTSYNAPHRCSGTLLATCHRREPFTFTGGW